MTRITFYALLAPAILLGSGLRLYRLSTQWLLSDEWHGLHAAATASYQTLFGLLTLGATSIPMNLYYKLLLDTVGWSEMAVRLPSLVTGVAFLVVFPLLLHRLVGPRVTILATYLVAVSPLLIFYSRYSRPYSLVVLSTFVTIVSCYLWAVSGKRQYAVAFVVAGVAGAYLHIVELRFIALPLAFFFAVKAVELYRRPPVSVPRRTVVPSLGALSSTGLIMGLAIAGLLLPAVLQTGSRFFRILQRGELTGASVTGAFELFCGTANPAALVLLTVLTVLGLLVLFRRNRLLAGLLSTVVGGSLATVWVSSPVDSNVAIVIARYSLPLLPLFAIAVATGVDGLLAAVEACPTGRTPAIRILAVSLIAVLLTVLVVLGPLPRLYAGTNDFTNHKAYQASPAWPQDYRTHFATYRRLMRGERVTTSLPASAFYRQLAGDPEVTSVIEFPVPVGDMLLPFFSYQRLHQKRVLGGYTRRQVGTEVLPGVAFANWPIDLILGQVEDPERLRFTTLVDLTDLKALTGSGSRYLIVHSNLELELAGQPVPMGQQTQTRAAWAKYLGEPVFMDDWLMVFDVELVRSRIR
jgi:hypothetical protein